MGRGRKGRLSEAEITELTVTIAALMESRPVATLAVAFDQDAFESPESEQGLEVHRGARGAFASFVEFSYHAVRNAGFDVTARFLATRLARAMSKSLDE